MKQVVYMDGAPIQHPGVRGRELPLKPCEAFTELDAERLFLSAGKVENFVDNIYRAQSFEEAYKELKELQDVLKAAPIILDISKRYRVERLIRSFYLEADVFFSHWRRFLGTIKKEIRFDIYDEMEKNYKKDPSYELLRIIRNYIMHSGEIVQASHIGFDDVQFWADPDIIKNNIRDQKDKKILQGCGDKIDLLKLADDAYALIMQIQEFFLLSLAKKDTRIDLRIECEYLLSMKKRITLYKSSDWFAISYKGPKSVNVSLPYVGGVTGLGLDYFRLNWKMYEKIHGWLMAALTEENPLEKA